MYHEMTYEEIAHRRHVHVVVAVLSVLLCLVLALALVVSARVSRRQAVDSVRQSVTTAAAQCAAVEGSYPSSLAHLEQHYGLLINHDHYLVNYEWFADNVPPTVTVVAR